MEAFALRARAQGACLQEETTATAIDRDADGAVCAVQTTAGRLEAEVVVNAAGPWAVEVGRLLSVELPPGAREVRLWFDSPAYATGKVVSLVALLIALAMIMRGPPSVPAVISRRH